MGACFLRGGGATGESRIIVGSDSRGFALGVGGMGMGIGGVEGAGEEMLVSIRRGGVLDLRSLNFGAVCLANADCEPLVGGEVAISGV